MLDKKAILAAPDLDIKEISVKAWGGDIVIRQLSGKERAEFEDETSDLNESKKQSDQIRAMAIFCTYIICDENQKRIFESDEADSLSSKSLKALKHIFNEGLAFNAARPEDIDNLAKK